MYTVCLWVAIIANVLAAPVSLWKAISAKDVSERLITLLIFVGVYTAEGVVLVHAFATRA